VLLLYGLQDVAELRRRQHNRRMKFFDPNLLRGQQQPKVGRTNALLVPPKSKVGGTRPLGPHGCCAYGETFIETMYVAPFLRYSASKNGVTLKLRVGVVQGH